MVLRQNRKRVLFLCTGNSARSQMAEGLLRAFDPDRFEVFSAGTIASFVRPQSIAVMKEIGIDISGHKSKSVDQFLADEFDYVITVCDNANRRCPIFPGPARRLHWSIDDPVDSGSESEPLAAFRRARDELQQRIRKFIQET